MEAGATGPAVRGDENQNPAGLSSQPEGKDLVRLPKRRSGSVGWKLAQNGTDHFLDLIADIFRGIVN